MLSSKLLLALLGLSLLGLARSEDVADGEVVDEGAAPADTKEDVDDGVIGPSPDAAVSFLFTQPADANVIRELLAGKIVKFLIGFRNQGEKDFNVKFSETSFRYHQDFNYHIQNFTHGQYNRRVQPKEEVTLDYAFPAHDGFAGRPLGLVVNLHYEDSEGRYFIHSVFNETITVIEDETGFNTETYFLYLIFAGLVILLLLVGQHFLNKLTRKHGMTKRTTQPVEVGTTNRQEVDFEWIPREVLKSNEKKSPKPGSPRQRKVQKAE